MLPLLINDMLPHCRNSLHCDTETIIAYGSLYAKYEAHATWYELIQVRRADMHLRVCGRPCTTCKLVGEPTLVN